tara:strand:+ start:4409 stop:5263 length:855 start_codon:yes stop_codon:yes gene_type:complete
MEAKMFIDESSKPKEKLKAWYLFTEDFIAGTQHMTNEEIGIYIRLLCWNWNKRCKGIPHDENLIFRVAMAFEKSEKITCLKVLSENFRLINESHWQNERQLQEYLYITKKIDSSKANGKLGGRPKKPNDNPPTSTPTPTSTQTIYTKEFDNVWGRLYNKRGSKFRAYEQYKIAKKTTDDDTIVLGYNKLCSNTEEKKYIPHFSKWLKDKRWEEDIPDKYQSFGVVNQEENRLQMFTDAIRDKKVTRFIKDWALKNKDVIDLGIKKGKITKQQAIEDLGMVNEYR